MEGILVARWTVYFATVSVIATVLDLCSTYYVTPDLKNEANLVIKLTGRSWITMFLVKGVGVSVGIAFFYYGMAAIDRRVERLAGTFGSWAIYCQLFYGRQISLYEMMVTQSPNDRGAFLAFLGIGFALMTGPGSIIAVVSNVTFFVTSPFRMFSVLLVGATLASLLAAYLIVRYVAVARELQVSVIGSDCES